MKTIRTIFTRAFKLSWDRKKLIATFIALLCVGLIVTFCQVGTSNAWLNIGFTLLPFFLGGMLLIPLGILLVRLYHDEVTRGKSSITETVRLSWELMISSSYLMLPLLLTFLLFWAGLGLFALLQEIPGLHILLSFAPFILLFGCLVLASGALFLLFVGPAILGLSNRKEVRKALGIYKRLKKDPLGYFSFFLLGLIPSAFVFLFLCLTNRMMFPIELSVAGQLLRNFIIMIPFAALMTFPTVFFFNISAESHAYLDQ